LSICICQFSGSDIYLWCKKIQKVRATWSGMGSRLVFIFPRLSSLRQDFNSHAWNGNVAVERDEKLIWPQTVQ
jgi:hypothetical protein